VAKSKKQTAVVTGDLVREISDRLHDATMRDDMAEKIVQAYLDVLDLQPNDDWSPRTRLEFVQTKTAIIERLLNRTEGMPVARQRNVDKNDEDVLTNLRSLPSSQIEQMILALLSKGAQKMVQEAEPPPADITVEAQEVPA
jgi:restriction endonuclease Mrr